MHFVLSTVVETLQPVLAPLSAAPNDVMESQTLPSNAQQDATGLWQWLSWWDGFWNEACPLKAQSESKAFQKRGVIFFVCFLSSCMIQSFLRPIQGLGAKVEVIRANQRNWYGCKGWCPDCQEHLTLTYKRSKVSRSLSGCHMNYFLCCWKRFPAVEAYIIFTTWMLWTLIAFLLFCTGSYPRNSVRPWPVG